MKKRYGLAIITAVLMLAIASAGCGNTEQSTSSESVKSESAIETVSTEAVESVVSSSSQEEAAQDSQEDIQAEIGSFVTGTEDAYVQEGAEDVEYNSGVVYDSSVIKSVTEDTSSIDTQTAGEYKIIYRITYDPSAFAKYASSTSSSGTEATVEIEKTVCVVPEDEAQSLADEGTPVMTGGSETRKTSDGQEVKIKNTIPESVEETGGAPVNASTGEKVEESAEDAADSDTEQASESDTDTDTENEDNDTESGTDTSDIDTTNSSTTKNSGSSSRKTTTRIKSV